MAHESGAAAVFLVLPDCPTRAAAVRRGIRALQAGLLPEAQQALRTAVSQRNAFSDLARLRLAETYRLQGDLQRAAETVALPEPYRTLHGGSPLFTGEHYGRIMIEAAAASGAILVNATSTLEQMPWVFTDFGHFDAEGHEAVARLLAGRLAPLVDAEADGVPGQGEARSSAKAAHPDS